MSLDHSFSYVSVATRDYLPGVAVLAESLRKVQPDARLTCYLVENEVLETDTFQGLFDVILILELDLPDEKRFIFQYPPFALCCALKPLILLHQLELRCSRFVVFFDSDMKLYRAIEPILIERFRLASVLLTPHLLHPVPPDQLVPIFLTGLYNIGFIAISNDFDAKEMLTWWGGCVKKNSIEDPYGAIYYEQRWLDIMPIIFPETKVFRHPGVNVGHWNIHEKQFTRINDEVHVDSNNELCLFHFSGLTTDGKLKHLPEDFIFPTGYQYVQELIDQYLIELQEKKRFLVETEYSFSRFSDGTIISLELREVVRLGLSVTENPFANKDEVLSKVPKDIDVLIQDNKTLLLGKVSLMKSMIERIRSHMVIGLVWKLWEKWINPSLKMK